VSVTCVCSGCGSADEEDANTEQSTGFLEVCKQSDVVSDPYTEEGKSSAVNFGIVFQKGNTILPLNYCTVLHIF
jgi:hypothetical protein